MAKDNTTRFSSKVSDYVKYRPDYPEQIIAYLQQEYGLSTDKIVADIGSGTGISSVLFLAAGYTVMAVEPNKEMREQSRTLLGTWPRFSVAEGTAEHTALASGSIDAIIAGQAFHWFDTGAAKKEFKRILNDNGIVALIWNERLTDAPFEKDYDRLIAKHGKDYVQVNHRNIDTEHLAAFYSPQAMKLETFPNKQIFDFEGLKGRLLSSSYMPGSGEPGYKEMVADLKVLFDRYQENQLVRINYTTKLYTGRLG
jgi:SAM-dependent methyltransferase